MDIIYNDTKKDLPSEQLHKLFMSVGWSNGSETSDMISNYITRISKQGNRQRIGKTLY
ncbi:hypothetical protein KL86SPO_31193 [uncultured Sporomusa sp.]|uniref:Uncharacterized protein n=1 Tax=uncultured Sporomusa sp. TaxID=307249 RepID=A0A212LTU0_9FIRM|nr:hypothetical protein [uncultured Sporomusa sp.]SCM81014.1 hypothetical protein KL86SPO_31193 [uncultured Sporomusa sp.]